MANPVSLSGVQTLDQNTLNASTDKRSDSSADVNTSTIASAGPSKEVGLLSKIGNGVKYLFCDLPKYIINFITCGCLFAEDTNDIDPTVVSTETEPSLIERINDAAARLASDVVGEQTVEQEIQTLEDILLIDVSDATGKEKTELVASVMSSFNENISQDLKDIIYGAVSTALPEGDERTGEALFAEDPFAQAPVLANLKPVCSSIQNMKNTTNFGDPSKVREVLGFVDAVRNIELTETSRLILCQAAKEHLQGTSEELTEVKAHINPRLFGSQGEAASMAERTEIEFYS